MTDGDDPAKNRVENISSQRMGDSLSARPFLPSVSLKAADSWRKVGELAEGAAFSGLDVLRIVFV